MDIANSSMGKRWDARGEVVLGMISLPDLRSASDQTLSFKALDDKGTHIAVDREDRKLVDGKSYIWTRDGEAMFFSLWIGGRMILREGPDNGHVVPFDIETCRVLGRVVATTVIE